MGCCRWWWPSCSVSKFPHLIIVVVIYFIYFTLVGCFIISSGEVLQQQKNAANLIQNLTFVKHHVIFSLNIFKCFKKSVTQYTISAHIKGTCINLTSEKGKIWRCIEVPKNSSDNTSGGKQLFKVFKVPGNKAHNPFWFKIYKKTS